MKDYYELPKNKQWLPEGDSPYSVGGRLTDVSCIASEFERIIKHQLGSLPPTIKVALQNLSEHLEQSEQLIQEFVMLVANEHG